MKMSGVSISSRLEEVKRFYIRGLDLLSTLHPERPLCLKFGLRSSYGALVSPQPCPCHSHSFHGSSLMSVSPLCLPRPYSSWREAYLKAALKRYDLDGCWSTMSVCLRYPASHQNTPSAPRNAVSRTQHLAPATWPPPPDPLALIFPSNPLPSTHQQGHPQARCDDRGRDCEPTDDVTGQQGNGPSRVSRDEFGGCGPARLFSFDPHRTCDTTKLTFFSHL
jgi:hypothetical protein